MADVEEDRRQSMSIRLPPSMIEEVRKLAKREKRTQTSIIELALAEYLERQGSSGLPDELERAVADYLARHR